MTCMRLERYKNTNLEICSVLLTPTVKQSFRMGKVLYNLPHFGTLAVGVNAHLNSCWRVSL